MNTDELFLVIFSLSTFFLVIFSFMTTWSNDRKYSSYSEIKELIIENRNISEVERINLLISLNKDIKEVIPWYQKSISTIGIVAFISMIFAISLQTVTLTKESINLESMKFEISKLKESKEEVEKIISDTTITMYKKYAETGRLSDREISIIKFKIKELENEKSPNYQQIYQFSMLIGDFNKAIEAIPFVDKSKPIENIPDVISLAQYYYIIDDIDNAKKMTTRANDKVSSLIQQPYWVLQLGALKSLLKIETDEEIISQISYSININNSLAQKRIEKIKSDLENSKKINPQN